jgi:uncharacterized phiE125 gp8 family phage protein
MWYSASIATPPSVEPVTVAEVKAQAIIDHGDDDEFLGRLIATARSHVEAYCNIDVAEQTVSVRCDRFDDFVRLPIAPVQDIDSIKYVDAAGVEQTLPDTVYELRNDDLEVSLVLKAGQRWPAIQPGSRITVTGLVGYEELPPAIKHAMLLWIAESYANREIEVAQGFTAFDALLCNFRRGV